MVRTGLLMAFALAGCSQAPSGAGNEAGAQPSATASGPALPDYLPLYPGASPVAVPTFGGNRPTGNAVAVETDASPAEIFAFYRGRLAAAGVPIRADDGTDAGGIMSAGRDGELGVMLTVTRSGNRTRITYLRRAGAR
jgi:hypothetical protein